MSINATNWSNTTINASNYLGDRNNEIITIGSPFGLLLSITQAQSVDTPVFDYSTNWTSKTINSTYWTQT